MNELLVDAVEKILEEARPPDWRQMYAHLMGAYALARLKQFDRARELREQGAAFRVDGEHAWLQRAWIDRVELAIAGRSDTRELSFELPDEIRRSYVTRIEIQGEVFRTIIRNTRLLTRIKPDPIRDLLIGLPEDTVIPIVAEGNGDPLALLEVAAEYGWSELVPRILPKIEKPTNNLVVPEILRSLRRLSLVDEMRAVIASCEPQREYAAPAMRIALDAARVFVGDSVEQFLVGTRMQDRLDAIALLPIPDAIAAIEKMRVTGYIAPNLYYPYLEAWLVTLADARLTSR